MSLQQERDEVPRKFVTFVFILIMMSSLRMGIS